MEKRTCKLCFKTFSNGRALGGHMRSHMLKLQASPLPPPPPSPPSHLFRQLDCHTDSASYGYSSEEDDDKGLGYELRENPRKSFRLVDPEFASLDAGSVVHDRESESESSRNLSGRRSKRSRKTGLIELPTHLRNQDYRKRNKLNSIEHEPLSSVSDTTPEEDVAWSLMLLSRGITGKEVEEEDEEEDEEEVQVEDEEDEEEKSIDESEDEKLPVKRSRGKFQCGTCKKFFRSYQALGGHRASHKKMKGCNSTTTVLPPSPDHNQEGNVVSATPPPTSTNVTDPRTHECPVCFRVFSSGQALGGHKRSHLTGSASASASAPAPAPSPLPVRATNADSGRMENNLNLIDLNLPAPMDDDEEHFELSAVSDGEFNKQP